MNDDLRVLSIRQPWAWLITSGHKTIENRTWSSDYRGPILIHAGRHWDPSGFDRDFEKWLAKRGITLPLDLPRGGIVGAARISDVVTHSADPFFFGPYGFALQQAKPLPFLPCNGQLNLYRPTDAQRRHFQQHA